MLMLSCCHEAISLFMGDISMEFVTIVAIIISETTKWNAYTQYLARSN